MNHNVLRGFEEIDRDVGHEQHRYDHWNNPDEGKVVAIIVDDVKRVNTIDDKHDCNGSDREVLNKKIQQEERNRVEDEEKASKQLKILMYMREREGNVTQTRLDRRRCKNSSGNPAGSSRVNSSSSSVGLFVFCRAVRLDRRVFPAP